MKTKQIGLLAALLGALAVQGVAHGASYSIREGMIRSKIPAEYKGHTNGIITSITDADVASAEALGVASKDKRTLEYAYLTKAPKNPFADDTIYVRVTTPLCLIAEHAREQAREFRKVDDGYVSFARGLGAVRISITQQYVDLNTWNTLPFGRTVILLRDGTRVESLKEILAWQGRNPFADKPTKEMQAALSGVTAAATQFGRASAANMTPEQKDKVIRSYQAMGLSEDQMIAYTGWSREEIQGLTGAAAKTGVGKLALSEADAAGAMGQCGLGHG